MSYLATHLVYAAAGSPEREDFTAVDGPCWWCGRPSPTGRGWPLKRLSASFQEAHLAKRPDSESLCAPCAWTMAVGFDLPPAYARDRLKSKAAQGRRVDLEVEGERVKRLALVLADGRIGLWTTASGGKEKPWQEAAKVDLAETPRTVGPCEYLGAFPLSSLTPGADRFVQAFHHWVVDGVWTACTDADKPAVRAHLLRADLHGPGCTSLALAQGKHTLIHTPAEHPETGMRTVYALGVVHYRPDEFAEMLWAFESLRLAGAGADEILSGEYSRGGLAMLGARRRCDPAIAPHRGSRLLHLAAYLCRPWPEIQAAPPAHPSERDLSPPTTPQDVPHGRPRADVNTHAPPLTDEPSRAGHSPADSSRRPTPGPRQLALF